MTAAADTITVTFFASAAEAAGTSEVTVPRIDGETYAELLDRVAEGNGELSRIVATSAVFVDGTIEHDLTGRVRSGAVDVLPPFAGG